MSDEDKGFDYDPEAEEAAAESVFEEIMQDGDPASNSDDYGEESQP